MLRIEIGKSYVVDYTNFRGERAEREIRVIGFEFGSNKYHPEPGLIVLAVDVARNVERTFAASGLHHVRAA